MFGVEETRGLGWRVVGQGPYSPVMKQAGLSMMALAAAVLLQGGCLERRVSITSDPPGAIVTMNDMELGRTPLEADFTHYGVYDIRVEHEGYEPLRTTARARTPLYEYVPVDLATTAMPVTFKRVVPWHFALAQSPESTLPPEQVQSELIGRAKQLREQLPAK